MYDIRSAMLNIGIVFTPGKFKINLEKTWKTPGILVNLRSTDPVISSLSENDKQYETKRAWIFLQSWLVGNKGILKGGGWSNYSPP